MSTPISNSDLAEVPVENVEVKTKPTEVKSKIGSEAFIEVFSKLMSHGPEWRTPKTLGEKLGVDPVDLAAWMDKQRPLMRKPGKEDGTVYYAIAKRVEAPSEKRPPGIDRKVTTVEDSYTVAELHMVLDNLYDVLEKRGMRIYERSEEGFKAILQARDRLDAGFALVANAVGTERDKLKKKS